MNQYEKGIEKWAIVSVAIAATASLSLMLPAWSKSGLAVLEDSPKTIVDETWQIVNREYVDPTFNQVDWQEVRHSLLSKEYTSQKQAYAAIRTALRKLEDPYTRFLDPEQFQKLTEQTSGELSGVGMSLEFDGETKSITVVKPYENSPALAAGIQAGDRILAIDGKSTKNMSLKAAVKLIRGEVGTEVTLELSRRGRGIFEVEVTRAKIEVPAVNYALKEEGHLRIGYIRLSDFSSHAAEQMEGSISDLQEQQVDGFVLDLRGNPGGLLQASIEIARMWMDKGAIVSTIDRDGNREALQANGKALTKLPLAVLVNGNSASSSEILTGALQDHKRAQVIGTQTFGKALVQAVHTLSDGSGLAVTVAHYYTPKGTDISQTGIIPDIEIKMTDKQLRRLLRNPKLLATQQDPQYARAIATLKVEIYPKPLAINESINDEEKSRVAAP
ncbi:MAG: S41 family peptidase [Hormoscilla sp. GM102CHS1]|nr:S41 family peptidase [Hormoscilla sp. GM102CHS1]